MCGHCIEAFDHHCPFINNCLGYRNHKYFLIFITSYCIYLLSILGETIRHVYEAFNTIDESTGEKKGWSVFADEDYFPAVLFFLILLHFPVLLYQIIS